MRKDWDSIRRGFLRSQALRLLDYTGFTLAAALGGYLFYAVTAKALASSPNWAASLQQWILQLSTGAGLVILCGALVLVGRKRIANWIASF